MRSTALFALAAVFLPTVLAQTFTSCNPLNNTDCPLDTALGVANYSIDFTTSVMSSTVWNTTAGTINYGDDGAEFTIVNRGDAPTVQTNFYYFFGQAEVWMKASPGTGIISSIVLESDDLDEVDWELMGGNDSYVETNYFGKGNTTSYTRADYYPIDTPQEDFHNYTTDWSAEKIDWYVDGQIVRTLLYEDADGGKNFPQTPMNLRIGIWAGGDSKNPNGTIEWAGGVTDYSKGPFTMAVKSVRVSDASRGTQYKYGDESGSWQSIQILNNTKPLALDGNNSESTTQDLKQKWNGMSSTAKIATAASVGGVVLICVAVFSFCCVKQRRAGRRERELEDQAFEKNTQELLAYRQMIAQQKAAGVRVNVQAVNPQYGPPAQQYGVRSQQQYGGQGTLAPQTKRASWLHGAPRGYQRF